MREGGRIKYLLFCRVTIHDGERLGRGGGGREVGVVIVEGSVVEGWFGRVDLIVIFQHY